MTPSDPYGGWDAAYVLGALNVQQRHEYEDHLAGCPDCRGAVGELAVMPGLLAQLPAAEAIALSDRGTAPESEPVPDSIRNMAPPRRFDAKTRLLLVAAVVLALVVGGIGGFLMHGAVAPSHHGSSVVVGFSSQQPTGVIANATLTPSGSTTKISIDCVVAQHVPGQQKPVDLVLQTVDNNGQTQQLWQWWASPGSHTTWGPHATPLRFDRIATLRIVDVDTGKVVLSAPVN